MTKNLTGTDESSLATAIRTLARRAHRVVNAPPDGFGGRAAEAQAVMRQIHRLRDQLPAHPRTDLHRWLDRLQEIVAASHPAPYRPVPTCCGLESLAAVSGAV